MGNVIRCEVCQKNDVESWMEEKGYVGEVNPDCPDGSLYLYQCPKCKTMETIEIVDDRLTPCSKFYQRGGNIYHDCG